MKMYVRSGVHHNTYTCTVEMECNSVDCIIISLYTSIYMDVDLMDCTEFFTIVVLTVLVNFFHLNFILDNTSVLVVAQYY